MRLLYFKDDSSEGEYISLDDLVNKYHTCLKLEEGKPALVIDSYYNYHVAESYNPSKYGTLGYLILSEGANDYNGIVAWDSNDIMDVISEVQLAYHVITNTIQPVLKCATYDGSERYCYQGQVLVPTRKATLSSIHVNEAYLSDYRPKRFAVKNTTTSGPSKGIAFFPTRDVIAVYTINSGGVYEFYRTYDSEQLFQNTWELEYPDIEGTEEVIVGQTTSISSPSFKLVSEYYWVKAYNYVNLPDKNHGFFVVPNNDTYLPKEEKFDSNTVMYNSGYTNEFTSFDYISSEDNIAHNIANPSFTIEYNGAAFYFKFEPSIIDHSVNDQDIALILKLKEHNNLLTNRNYELPTDLYTISGTTITWNTDSIFFKLYEGKKVYTTGKEGSLAGKLFNIHTLTTTDCIYSDLTETVDTVEGEMTYSEVYASGNMIIKQDGDMNITGLRDNVNEPEINLVIDRGNEA